MQAFFRTAVVFHRARDRLTALAAEMSADAKDAKAPPGGPGQVLAVPLLLFGLGGAAWYEYTMDMAWFSHHPASMLVAFVALGGNAALIKKKGGYANTKTHGNVMSLAMALALFGPLSFCHRLVSQPACASLACQRGACCAPTRSLTQAAPAHRVTGNAPAVIQVGMSSTPTRTSWANHT